MRTLGLLAVAVLIFSGSAAAKNGWRRLSREVSSEELVSVTLPVKQANLEIVDKLFWELSDPKHSNYGKFLTHEQVALLVQNREGTNSAVQFLLKNGVSSLNVTKSGSYVSAQVPVALANRLFNADFAYYEHPESSETVLKTESANLPAELVEHVSHLPHISFFPRISQRVVFAPAIGFMDAALGSASSDVPKYVSPQTLYKYYGISNTVVSNGATQSLFEALGQDFDNNDLNLFQSKFGLNQFNVSKVIGRDAPTDCFTKKGGEDCGEANLDVQYIMAIAQNAETVYWSIDAQSEDPFLTWAQQVSTYSNPPQVFSISYGGYEDTSNDDMKTFNTEVQKLGIQGVSVLVSSGDDGAGNSLARSDAKYCGYYASFPASSPYVTAVGATQGPESGAPEIACSSATGGVITSGGGFSAVFNQPEYQKTAVAQYFQTVETAPVSGYNSTGRGYPDVSTLGYNYAVVIGGKFALESGTSASAPVFAGMITLINDARLAQGKSSLGFLNQALYSLDSSVWNDVTSGDNKCTANPKICCKEGFQATAGWDPLTGLGTPIFPKLKDALVNL